jgi:hypothetical protein
MVFHIMAYNHITIVDELSLENNLEDDPLDWEEG